MMIMDYLKKEVPTFIKTANSGALKRNLEGKGIRFK